MRPPITTNRALDLPRWRRRRAFDLQALALTYGVALGFYIVLFAVASFAPDGLAYRTMDFTGAILIAFLFAAYVAIGGSIVAMVVRRLAYWNGRLTNPLGGMRWVLVIFWPLTVAALLLKAAVGPWE